MTQSLTQVLKRFDIRDGFELQFVLSQADTEKTLHYARCFRDELDIERETEQEQMARPVPGGGLTLQETPLFA